MSQHCKEVRIVQKNSTDNKSNRTNQECNYLGHKALHVNNYDVHNKL
jgi:hypothetical protein